ncbi:MAG: hypothetical protein IPK76_14475 [Lewinellaceae bacterium]|nr:hypothetical protein [Lewinellaceae bacterium]
MTSSAGPAKVSVLSRLVLRATDAVTQAGAQLDLVFEADRKDLSGFSLLNFDPAQLQFLNVQPMPGPCRSPRISSVCSTQVPGNPCRVDTGHRT